MKDIYINVALPLPFFEQFLYRIPYNLFKELSNKELIGRRVLVPFRNTGYTGIITDILDIEDKLIEFEARDIEEIPDQFNLFTKQEINIAKKLADYYVSPLGMVLSNFIPSALKWKKKNGKWDKTYPDAKIYSIGDIKETKLTKSQKELIDLLKQYVSLTEEEILDFGFTKQTINSLLKKGILKAESLSVSANKDYKMVKPQKDKILQKGIYYLSSLEAEKRIEIYINHFRNLVRQNKSALIVFPNVVSLKRAYEIISSHIDEVFIYTEMISPKQNIKTIKHLIENVGILLTTYSGMLIPIKNLSTVIVEEEQSNTYKTQRTPRFDIRRLAFYIYKEKSTTLVYSSYVPSVESYFSIKNGQFKPLVKDWKKFDNNESSITIYPFDKEKIFSKVLKNIINKNTLIIANKKAYASFLYCQRCEDEIICENCEIPLRIYKDRNVFLKCELCSQRYKYIEICPECKTNLIEVGTGIQKLYEFLSESGVDVSYLEQNKKTDVKITTTIVDKEIYIDKFDNVINIYPDFYLYIPDFRGREKFYKNILYSYIKARKSYYLITNQYNDISIESLIQKDMDLFFEDELKIRKQLKQPPYSKYIILTFQKKDLDIQFLDNLFKIWIKANNIKDFAYKGVLKGHISKIKGMKTAQVLLIDFKEKHLLVDLYKKSQKLGVKLIIDVDPVKII